MKKVFWQFYESSFPANPIECFCVFLSSLLFYFHAEIKKNCTVTGHAMATRVYQRLFGTRNKRNCANILPEKYLLIHCTLNWIQYKRLFIYFRVVYFLSCCCCYLNECIVSNKRQKIMISLEFMYFLELIWTACGSSHKIRLFFLSQN